MGLKYVFQDGLNCPTIICDSCQQPINDGNGMVLWDTDDVTRTESDGLIFVHKLNRHKNGPAPCQEAKWRFWSWDDIDVFLIYLLNNVGVNLNQDAKARAHLLSMI